MTIFVNKNGDRWEARFPWSVQTKDFIKSQGFRFDGTKKVWWTQDPDVAARVAEPDALEAWMTQEAEALQSSRQVDANIDVPLPAGLSLLPYQKAGVAYALARQATLFGDEMGLGKTVQAIATCNAFPTAVKNVLIVCPASLKLNWVNEWRKWDVRGLPVRIVDKAGIVALPLEQREPDFVGVVIINYERVKNHRDDIDLINWDVLICDEVHYMKSAKAQRKQYVLGKWEKNKQTGEFTQPIKPIQATYRLFLTGTPIVNKPIELWPIVQALDRKGLGRSRGYFEQRYCGLDRTAYGRDASGASNLEELQERMRKAFMVRRLKKDVLKELPPKRRTVVLFEPSRQQEALIAREQELLRKTGIDPDKDFDRAVAELQSPKGVAFEEIARLRHDVAVSKIPAVIEYLDEMLGQVDKVVIMAHHHAVIDAIRQHYGGIMSVVVDGRTKVEDRQPAVERFQNDKTCRVFIGSIRAAGVGLTLTAASTVIFAELDWTPGNVSQAEDRCHRIGQHDMVNVYHLVLDRSLDARMAKIIVAKQGVIDEALDKPMTGATGKAGVAGAVAATPESPAAGTPVTKPLVSEGCRVAVHQCLRILAGMCDGALMRDECGFNAYDTNFGKDLAARDLLTDRQVIAGAKLVRKYKRQLPAELLAVIKEVK